MALVAFTLVMTVFAIIEPLRKQGLGGGQVASLFIYTLPVMLSLTLPIGALFAATIVYGRFSQDNELLACRASGISTISLLKPALVLASIVTVASLVLSNFISPAMAARAGKAIKTNIRGIIYNQLRSRKYVEYEPNRNECFVIHADYVDKASDTLYGVVGVHIKHDTGSARLATASSTKVMFFDRYGENYVAFDALDLSGGGLGSYDTGSMRRQPFPPMEIPDPTKQKPSWCNWGQLLRMIDRPVLNRRIARELNKIRRSIAHDLFCREAVEAISGRSAKGYFQLSGSGRSYLISAGGAETDGIDKVKLNSTEGKSVCVTFWPDDAEAIARRAYGGAILPAGPVACVYASQLLSGAALPWIVTAKAGRINVEYDRRSDTSNVSILLGEGASITMPALGGRVMRRREWSAHLPIPARIVSGVRNIGIENIYSETALFTNDAGIIRRIDILVKVLIPRLMGKLIGEMHGRIAYGVSCFILVALGAALGLIFRGGQILSAFAISVIPAAGVIVLVIMGKEMARNSRIPVIVGLSVIWAGVVVLFAICALVYLHLCRK